MDIKDNREKGKQIKKSWSESPIKIRGEKVKRTMELVKANI